MFGHFFRPVVLACAGLTVAVSCSANERATPETSIITAASTAGATGTSRLVAGAEAKAIVESGDVVVVDVRTPEEFAAGHLKDAQLIDIKDATFASKIAALDKTKTYFIYCRSGNRSAQAVIQMNAIGLNTLDAGGFDDLAAAGLATA